MTPSLYPKAPETFLPQLLAPSAGFKKQVGKVIFSVILFFIVYILLIIAAAALAVACCFFGWRLIVASPRFLTLLLGGGLMAVGVSVFFFLVKFVFAVTKDENDSRIEINEKDQPALFAFIKRLSAETNTVFPKKIFISPDVNACVFYNSSFWSMFFPVRKNLEIGLGLVNSINISEFKAVIAHEFGHFSQRSMKLGSFTYNVNRMIYNMLYENTGYSSFLSSWGNLHGILGLFAEITSKIAVGIQAILKEMYKIVNKNYMGLSREMEFHADAVASSVAGANNLISGLARIEIAASCYASAVEKANAYLKDKKISANLYDNQLTILRAFAKEHVLPVRNHLPDISYQFVRSFSKSRVNYKNQWASHPTLEERKNHAEKLEMNCDSLDNRAWEIFSNPEQLQETVTRNMYNHIPPEEKIETFDAIAFEEWQNTEKEKYQLPAYYKGYYDKRYPETKNWDLEKADDVLINKEFEQFFSDEQVKLFSVIRSNEADLELVKAIKEKAVDTKTFDFDGKKINREEAAAVVAQLEEDIRMQNEQLAASDYYVTALFLSKAGTMRNELKLQYAEMKRHECQHNQYVDTINKIFSVINPFYQGGLSLDEAQRLVHQLKEEEEPVFKTALRAAITNGYLDPENNPTLHESVTLFLSKDYAYFVAEQFNNNELEELSSLAISVADIINERRFAHYKMVLINQLNYANLPQ